MVMNPSKAQDVWKDAGEHVQFTVLELKRENQAKEQEAIQEFVERFQAITRSLRIRDNKGNLKVSLGFSNDAWDYLFPNAPKPKELETYQTLTGPKYEMPAAKGDIFLHIRANDEAAVYEFMAQVMLFIRDITNVVDETKGFRYFEGRAIIGFIDGTENPEPQDAAEYAIIGDEDPTFENGSYAFAQNERVKNAMLAALMGATTDVVNTIGKQFAQPLKVRNKDGSLKKNLAKKILSDRELDVFEQFEKWMQYYVELPRNTHDFEIICEDYVEVLKRLQPGDVKVIYADPPYTRYHYSRYYHILETICLHDNPQISTTFPNGKGGLSRAIYRNDRHQSPFCIKSKVPQAFDDLFMYASKAQASIVLSYSPFDANSGATPRLLSIEDIISIAHKYYNDVSVVSPGQFMHSRFNRQDNNYEINYEAERLVICRR